ncbi:MAG TPA: GMC family oxidoreductase [Rhizomicrobium sp.]|nr:GMC family oxidoreductase [Rhizomicrobium sp.]
MTALLPVTGPQSLSCEALVIGTGAGGASVAATLADAGVDVLMVEEGPYVPAAETPAGLSRSMLKMWRGGGLLATFGSQIAFAEGRCVGGGTEINSAIFQRAPDRVLRLWAAANGIGDFNTATLAPYFDRAAAAVNASLTPDRSGPPTELLARAGNAMKWNIAELERGQRHCVGTNLCSAGCPTGAKQSMTATLIPRAIERGARLLPVARVQRLTRRGNRIAGAAVQASGEDGKRHAVAITAESVFLCAGTTQTPALLARSGIRRNIGHSFQLHPTIRLLVRFRDEINAQRYRLPLVAITEFMPELRFGGSVFTLPTYGMALAEDWKNRARSLPDYASHAIYYAMIKPDGVGRIHSIPGMAEPVTSYALTERDRRRLWQGARMLSEALFAAGAEHVTPSVVGHEGWADSSAPSREDTLPAVGRINLMSIHLFSSCPMGEKADIHPVDSLGRLRGHDNVVVADGSVLPGAPGVNPQATIMALAMRAADAWIGRRGMGQ